MNQAVEVSEVAMPRTPAVGDSVAILHEVNRSKEGTVIGLRRTGSVRIAKVSAVYLDGSIRTGISDRWEVTRGGSDAARGATWQTVGEQSNAKN